MYRLHELNEMGIPSLIDETELENNWISKRADILNRWQSLIGEIPDNAPIQSEIHSEIKEDGFIRQHLTYNAVDGDDITAYLLIPDDASGKKSAAVIAMHGTDVAGKDSISTSRMKGKHNYGVELAKRGYVVLVPDALTAGERIIENEKSFHTAVFYRENPSWLSITAKNISDHKQGLEFLISHDLVDEDRIGAIGHSFGGYNAYYLAGMDNRIKAAVSSCGFSTFTGDYRPHQWAERDWYTHFPKLTSMIDEGEIPFEFHEILALAAPTPLFNWSAQSDAIFPHWKSIGSGLQHVSRLYESLGCKDRFISLLGTEEPDFPSYIREMAYRFLDKWLDHEPTGVNYL